jgi:hypothetical protein
MRRITWFDFLCAFALFFSACTSAVGTMEVEDESGLIDTTLSAIQTSTSSY